ncbi:hypothetical protein EDD64_13614 [Effusibacillus lacus]|nr:hypothetical protein EDD64_13614 [Effusibacillus lacus]
MQQRVAQIVEGLQDLQKVTKESIARFVESQPDAVPVIATCAGLGQEQLKNQLRLYLGTSGWIQLAKNRADELISVLDEKFGLIQQLQKELARDWTFSDILLEQRAITIECEND